MSIELNTAKYYNKCMLSQTTVTGGDSRLRLSDVILLEESKIRKRNTSIILLFCVLAVPCAIYAGNKAWQANRVKEKRETLTEETVAGIYTESKEMESETGENFEGEEEQQPDEIIPTEEPVVEETFPVQSNSDTGSIISPPATPPPASPPPATPPPPSEPLPVDPDCTPEKISYYISVYELNKGYCDLVDEYQNQISACDALSGQFSEVCQDELNCHMTRFGLECDGELNSCVYAKLKECKGDAPFNLDLALIVFCPSMEQYNAMLQSCHDRGFW